jgi:hypothetical protein
MPGANGTQTPQFSHSQFPPTILQLTSTDRNAFWPIPHHSQPWFLKLTPTNLSVPIARHPALLLAQVAVWLPYVFKVIPMSCNKLTQALPVLQQEMSEHALESPSK